jgi:diacylglycerol kinase family enzyme
MSTALLDREPVIGVITNPNSKKNRRRHNRVAELQAIIGRYGVVRQTTSTDAIGEVIGEFAERGVDFWVSDGGDGALHWMLNKAREQLGGDSFSIPRHLRYALPTNGGTIDYVARRAGVRGSAEEILRKLVSTYKSGGSLQEACVPSLVFTGVRRIDGRDVPFEKVGFAAAIAGVGNRFFNKYYEARIPGPKVIVEVVSKASVSLLVDQLPLVRGSVPPEWVEYGRQIMKPMPARVTADGRELPMKEFTTIACGAFKINLGGVMKMFPRAGKGFMHLSAGDPDMWDIIGALPRLVTGRQLKSNRLYDAPGRELTVEALTSDLLQPNIDGEFLEDVLRVTVRPGPRFRVPRIDAKSRNGAR